MTTTINADNGAVSGSAGLKSSADATGVLALQTNGTTAVTVDASQNVTLAGTLTTTGVTTVQAGTAALPAITTTGDTNTGIFFPAADTIAFAEGGAEAMRIDSSGNVGIGVTPSAKLQVNATNFALSTLYNTLTSNFAVRTTETQTANVGGEIALGGYITGLSNVGDFARIHGKKSNSTNGNANGYFAIEVSDDNTGPNYMVERMRINSSGVLLLGTTSAIDSETGLGVVNSTSGNAVVVFRNSRNTSGDVCAKLMVGSNCQNTSSYLLQGAVFGVANVIYIFGNGNIQNTNNSYGAISDVKLKENIVDATPKLADLMQVKVRSYNLIGSTTKQIGVVAQELETVFPAMIDETPDKDEEGNELSTKTKAVKYSVFVPMLIKAMQEQQALITQLQADVAALKGA